MDFHLCAGGGDDGVEELNTGGLYTLIHPYLLPSA